MDSLQELLNPSSISVGIQINEDPLKIISSIENGLKRSGF
jgi:hypothetical protein